MADTKKAAKAAKPSAARGTASEGWTQEELAAMKEHNKEIKAAKTGGKADGESEVLAKIAEMPPADRAIAERLHQIIRANAPDLVPRTYYGMPAYARDGKVLCFFQPKDKFKARYATLGFNDEARLDDGTASVAILIPEGFTDAVTAGRATDIRIVADPESPEEMFTDRTYLRGASALYALRQEVAGVLLRNADRRGGPGRRNQEADPDLRCGGQRPGVGGCHAIRVA